jgi:ABC-type branched-subunit amino acid transport system substrate-binding protein
MRRIVTIVGVAMALVVAGCGNSEESSGSQDDKPTDTTTEKVTVNAPGVTDTEIRVGGVASVTNPLGGKYGDAFDGVEAYFAMVNEAGGVHGRKLVLAEKKDDKLANNKSEVEALIADPNIFAVIPVATLLFTGADALADAKMPTFGWTINTQWAGKPTLFGQSGSFLCIGCDAPTLPSLAKELKKTKIGVLAYAVEQSSKCAEGVEKSFEKYGPGVGAEVAFADKALQYGDTNFSTQVSAMKSKGVDFVTTCMDTNGVVALAKEMKKQGLDAIQYLPNGYDHEFVKEFGDLFEGSVVRTDFVQWELPEKDQPKGLRDFLTWMDKTGKEPSENAMAGWLNADLFVRGLKAAGPDFDRQKVVDAINKMTDVTNDGLTRPTDWTIAHDRRASETEFCDFTSMIENSEFVPKFSKPGKPFRCVDATDPNNLKIFNAA